MRKFLLAAAVLIEASMAAAAVHRPVQQDPPWVHPETVEYTCSEKLTQVNAWSLCHFECGPSRGGAMQSRNCYQQCYARMCQYGR